MPEKTDQARFASKFLRFEWVEPRLVINGAHVAPPHWVSALRTKLIVVDVTGQKRPIANDEIRRGFAECFRVLAPLGTLIFKWNEHRVPDSTVLSLTPERPLFGQRCGTTAKTHWIVFMKPNAEVSDAGRSPPESAGRANRYLLD